MQASKKKEAKCASVLNGVLRDANWWEDSKSVLKIEIEMHSIALKMHSIPFFGQNTVENWQNTRFSLFSIVFWPRRGSNAVQLEFWGQIWNPLIIVHLLGTYLIWFSQFDFLILHVIFWTQMWVRVAFFWKCEFLWAYRDQRLKMHQIGVRSCVFKNVVQTGPP